MGGCMGQWVGSGQMTNLIKLELINIIWFCLKIYNLSRHPYLWVDGWVNGWAHVKPLKSNKFWPNWDNSIMDILDILLDILLKPPQPLMGLFFLIIHLLFQFHGRLHFMTEWQRQTTGVQWHQPSVWESYKITRRIIQLSRNIHRENIIFYFGLKWLHIFGF